MPVPAVALGQARGARAVPCRMPSPELVAGTPYPGRMPQRSTEFQRLVYLVKRHEASGAIVTESKLLADVQTGELREVDVTIEATVAGHAVTVSIECNERGRRADVLWVDGLIGKHERLPTNKLVLVSRNGFSKSARSAAKRYTTVELLDFAEADAAAPEILAGTSLFSKTVKVSAQRLLVYVPEGHGLPAETVRTVGETAIYDEAGKEIGPAAQMLGRMLASEFLQRELMQKGLEAHRWFELNWRDPVARGGVRLCLKKLTPEVLRPIGRITLGGTCEVRTAPISLKRARLGAVEVAWATEAVEGTEAMVVASRDSAGRAVLSLHLNGSVHEVPLPPTSGEHPRCGLPGASALS